MSEAVPCISGHTQKPLVCALPIGGVELAGLVEHVLCSLATKQAYRRFGPLSAAVAIDNPSWDSFQLHLRVPEFSEQYRVLLNMNDTEEGIRDEPPVASSISIPLRLPTV
jgi:hypothetical protein